MIVLFHSFIDLLDFLLLDVRNGWKKIQDSWSKKGRLSGGSWKIHSRPRPSESMKLFATYKLIPSTQNSTNVDFLELHL
jgi:hypothetical protein